MSPTQSSTEQQINSTSSQSEQIIEAIPYSPLVLCHGEEGYFIALGINRLTHFYNSKEELKKYMRTWNFRYSFNACIAAEIYNHLKQQDGQLPIANTGNIADENRQAEEKKLANPGS